MAEFGDPAAFLTEEEHHRYRALTTFLGKTNALDDPLASASPMNDYSGRKDRVARTYRYLADFTDLLPRHYEVVAVSPAIKDGVISAVETTLGEDEDEDYVYTNNPESREGDKGIGELPKGCAALFAEVQSADITTDSSPATLLLERTIELKNKNTIPGKGKTAQRIKEESRTQGSPRANFSLGEHGATLISLLRKTWNTVGEHEHEDATIVLERYVMINCCAKIHGRMKRGNTKGRKFLKHMTATYTDLDAASSNENSDDAYDNTFSFKQMRATESLLICMHTLGVDVEEFAQLRTFMAKGQPTPYDHSTRHMFQRILATVVGKTWECLDALHTLKVKLQKKHLKNVEALPKEACNAEMLQMARELDYAASKSTGWMQMLTTLVDPAILRPILTSHLTWMRSRVLLPRSSTDSYSTGSDSAAEAGVLEPGIGSSSPSRDERSDGAEALAEDFDDACLDDYVYASEYDGIDALLFRQDWVKGALKYLDIVCLHHTSMENLARTKITQINEPVSKFLEKASFQWIRHTQKAKDTRMMSLHELFGTLQREGGGKLNEDEVESLKTWLNRQAAARRKRLNQNASATSFKKTRLTQEPSATSSMSFDWDAVVDFSGNFHCETLLMSHHLLSLNREKLVQAHTAEKKVSEFLLLPDKEVTDRLSDQMRVLPVSKRCCPACASLVQYLIKMQREDILHPGAHTTWYATTLPPWIIRDAGLHVLQAAEVKATERVSAILREMRNDGSEDPGEASDFSRGTNPATYSRHSPILAPARLLRSIGGGGKDVQGGNRFASVDDETFIGQRCRD